MTRRGSVAPPASDASSTEGAADVKTHETKLSGLTFTVSDPLSPDDVYALEMARRPDPERQERIDAFLKEIFGDGSDIEAPAHADDPASGL